MSQQKDDWERSYRPVGPEMMDLSCTSDRLSVVTAACRDLRNDLNEDWRQSRQVGFGYPVPSDWPPPYWTTERVRACSSRADAQPHELFLRPWYVLRRGEDDLCVGVGWFGGIADSAGVVDVRLSIVESYQGQGIGSEAMRMLLRWPTMRRLANHCRATVFPQNPPGWQSVLIKNGFEKVGPDNSGAGEHWIRGLD